jgi:hypothetical protein
MADEVMAEDAEIKPLQSVLLVLRDAQAQHGLRHGDYARYRCAARRRSPRARRCGSRSHPRRRRRQYCARRLLRLYKMLGFSHGGGKSKYQSRTLAASDITDGRCVALAARCAMISRRWSARQPQTAPRGVDINPKGEALLGAARAEALAACARRHFLIPLVSAERAWAHAMELKTASRGDNARKRHHAIKRLAKAAAHAAQLAALTAARSDARTALEAEAYASWMGGNVLLERESDWGAALSRFTRAQAAYEQLAKVGASEEAAAARTRLSELEPALRFCRYKGGGVSAGDLSSMDTDSPATGLLAGKLEAVAAAEAARAGASGGDVVFRGVALHIASPGARAALAAAAQLAAQLDAPPALGAPAGADRALALYDKLLLALADAAASVRADAAAAGGAEPAAGQLRAADTAVAVMALRRTVDRNRLLLAGVQQRWARTLPGGGEPGPAAAAAPASGRRGERGERVAPARVQDVVRLYDTLLANLGELADVAADAARFASLPAGAAMAAALAAEAAAEGGVVRSERCAALARAHAAAGRHAEAAALYGRGAEHAARAGADAAAVPPPEGPRLVEAAAAARDAARRGRCAAVVAAAAPAAAARAAVTDAVAAVKLDDAHAAAAAAADEVPLSERYALDSLDIYVPAAGAGVRAGDVRLFPNPPPMRAVAARPMFLDTALTALPLPSVAHHARAAGSSRLGRLTSALGVTGVSSVSGAVSSLFRWRSSAAGDKSG